MSTQVREALVLSPQAGRLGAAENKKLFTRLWVHETMRYFYDRLTQQHEMDAVFNCIKGCVRAIFRENFDSAFEHLGKIDGQVTQVNLRNLLFGSYLPTESGETQYAEVQGFDQYEKIVQEYIYYIEIISTPPFWRYHVFLQYLFINYNISNL